MNKKFLRVGLFIVILITIALYAYLSRRGLELAREILLLRLR